MKIIAVSGVPGTGKTAVARELSKVLGVDALSLSEYVIERRLYSSYDEERQCHIVDEDAVRRSLIELYLTRGPIVVEGHYAELVPREILEVIFVLRRNPVELLDVLRARGWSPKKIAENVEAELLSVCTINAIEEVGEDKVVEVDVTGKSAEEVGKELLEILLGERSVYCGQVIDWLTLLPSQALERLLSFIESAPRSPAAD